MIALLRNFGSAIAGQGLLSVANLVATILLVRYAPIHDYGLYVLAIASLLLLTSVQNAFLGPQLVGHLTRRPPTEHAALGGGVFRSQQRCILLLAGAALFVALVGGLGGRFSSTNAGFLAAFAVAFVLLLRREFLRLLLLSHHQAVDTLKADALFAILLVAGVLTALFSNAVATVAILGLGLAGLGAAALSYRALYRAGRLDPDAQPAPLASWLPLGTLSAAGAAIHWCVAHGHNYLSAALLDVSSVAMIAAVRLVVMPVMLMSSGIGPLMLPLTSRWLRDIGATATWRRLKAAALAVAALALTYLTLAWILRDWIFISVLHKDFANRELMLLLWAAVAVLAVARDQLQMMLVARQRFRSLLLLGSTSACASLGVGLAAIPLLGPAGAVLGVLAGELVSLIGTLALARQDHTRHPELAQMEAPS